MASNQFESVLEFEKYAEKTLLPYVWTYYSGGAGYGFSVQHNREAFKKYRLKPRVLIDISQRDLSLSVLGSKLALPIGIAPTAFHKLAHPDGESATAKAAGEMGTIFTLSVWATTSIEEVAAAAPNTIKWMQTHIFKRPLLQNLVTRAEKAGFKAIVVTIDTPVFGVRYAELEKRFHFPTHLRLANLSEVENLSPTKESADNMIVKSHTWEHIKWLKSITNLPIVLKGILNAEDAAIAANIGIDAIQVSNHGSRQLDHTVSPLEVLPEIVKAVDGRCEVYMDSGIREGIDVFKALALGAKMVFIGRAVLWGLAADGEKGVVNVMDILKRELDYTLALTGNTHVTKINQNVLVPDDQCSKL